MLHRTPHEGLKWPTEPDAQHFGQLPYPGYLFADNIDEGYPRWDYIFGEYDEPGNYQKHSIFYTPELFELLKRYYNKPDAKLFSHPDGTILGSFCWSISDDRGGLAVAFHVLNYDRRIALAAREVFELFYYLEFGKKYQAAAPARTPQEKLYQHAASYHMSPKTFDKCQKAFKQREAAQLLINGQPYEAQGSRDFDCTFFTDMDTPKEKRSDRLVNGAAALSNALSALDASWRSDGRPHDYVDLAKQTNRRGK